MAILSKSGQLLANASQRTVVFDTIAQMEEFKASLPEGVNVDSSFDIYVKENATVYAAGEPFKMREVVAEGDVDVYFSTDGTGDGKTAETPISADLFYQTMASYAARYDFNNWSLNLHFAPGQYKGITFSFEFMNCGAVVVSGESPIVLNADGTVNSNICPVFTNNMGTARFSGATINVMMPGFYQFRQIGIECAEGALSVSNGATAQVQDIVLQWLKYGTMNTQTSRGIMIVSDPGSKLQILSMMPCMNAAYCEAFIAEMANDPTIIPDDAFFLAKDSGTLQLFQNANTFQDERGGKRGYFIAREAVFKCSNNGIISIAGNKSQTTYPIDDGVPLSQAKKPESGWLKAVTGGIVKISNSYNFKPVGDIVCDATAIIEDFVDVNI